MRRELRLRRRKDFDAVFRNGRIIAHPLLMLRSVPNQLPHNRYGYVTSKRLGNAVVRNRVRRRLREAARALEARPGWDVVLSARQPAAAADYNEIKSAVANLFARAGILAGEPPQAEGSRS